MRAVNAAQQASVVITEQEQKSEAAEIKKRRQNAKLATAATAVD